MKQSRHSSREVRAAAKALRQAETPAEQRLWRVLRGRAVNGLRFRRQHPLHGLVLDFFCADVGLCVELDGSVHDDAHQRERDHARTAHLGARGIRVIRFRNEEVLHDLPHVLRRIARAAAQTDRNTPD
ncbi:MAG: endonuclease domain-containing protein [Gemmatimonadetes bacterium]|nr:endonuclease domain-containing protein [Gemmatimonadota bacterium]